MSEQTPPSSGVTPVFDPAAEHHRRPKVRPVRGFPVQAQTQPGGKPQVMLGLSDARQISDKMVVTAPAFQHVLPKMDGARDVDQIVAEVGQGLTRPMMEGLIAQLDGAGLLEGPVFTAMLETMRRQFDSTTVLPPASSAAFADALVVQASGEKEVSDERKAEEGPERVVEAFDKWIAEVLAKEGTPSLDDLPKAIVAPHLDYGRGWMNYAGIYGRLRVCDRPDRVIVLGTNHFGQATGVCGCDKGYSTPLGVCQADAGVLGVMRSRLGDALFAHRYDHEREHSVELQIMWVQHVFGKDAAGNYPTVFGALVHDPAVNNGESYDGNGVGLEPFVEALKEAVRTLPGLTLIVSSADLSHVGPAFGDPTPLAGDKPEAVEFRNKVLGHDREMLALVEGNKPSELIAAMAWQQNPTRWCSTGNLVATLLAVEPAQVRLFNYTAAMDGQGMAMVSCVAMAMS